MTQPQFAKLVLVSSIALALAACGSSSDDHHSDTTPTTPPPPAATVGDVVALTASNRLVSFDRATPGTIRSNVLVTGLQSGENLVGIDVRPADGMLYGVGSTGRLYTLDAATGAATNKSRLVADAADTTEPFTALAGASFGVDFNPMADRLRFMTGTTNHRVNVDTGEVTVDGSLNWVAEDENSEASPMIAAAAYINSYGTPEATAMYNIDSGLGALLQQTAPNDGTLATIGMLNVENPGEMMAFDVQTDAEGANMAWLVTNNTIHSVDLETGAATAAGEIAADGQIRDLAVLPAM